MAKSRYKRTLVIDQTKWLNGTVLNVLGENANGQLRDKDTGLQCCMGFGCRAAGATAQSITDIGMPSKMSHYQVTDGDFLCGMISIQEAVAEENDDRATSLPARKRALRALFSTIDTKLVFTGDARKAVAHAKKVWGVK